PWRPLRQHPARPHRWPIRIPRHLLRLGPRPPPRLHPVRPHRHPQQHPPRIQPHPEVALARLFAVAEFVRIQSFRPATAGLVPLEHSLASYRAPPMLFSPEANAPSENSRVTPPPIRVILNTNASFLWRLRKFLRLRKYLV